MRAGPPRTCSPGCWRWHWPWRPGCEDRARRRCGPEAIARSTPCSLSEPCCWRPGRRLGSGGRASAARLQLHPGAFPLHAARRPCHCGPRGNWVRTADRWPEAASATRGRGAGRRDHRRGMSHDPLTGAPCLCRDHSSGGSMAAQQPPAVRCREAARRPVQRTAAQHLHAALDGFWQKTVHGHSGIRTART